jgi:hypothetical protein
MEFKLPNGKVINEESRADVFNSIDCENFTSHYRSLSIFDKRKAIEEFEFVLWMNEKWYKKEVKLLAAGVPLTLLLWFSYTICNLYKIELLVFVSFVLACVFTLMFLHSIFVTIKTFLNYRTAKIIMRLMEILIAES